MGARRCATAAHPAAFCAAPGCRFECSSPSSARHDCACLVSCLPCFHRQVCHELCISGAMQPAARVQAPLLLHARGSSVWGSLQAGFLFCNATETQAFRWRVLDRGMPAAHPWRRQLDLVVSVRVLPLQALSLFLLPLPWTLPRLFALLVSNPVAVVEGVHPFSLSPFCMCYGDGHPTEKGLSLLVVPIACVQAARLMRFWSARASWPSHCTGRLWCHTWG